MIFTRLALYFSAGILASTRWRFPPSRCQWIGPSAHVFANSPRGSKPFSMCTSCTRVRNFWVRGSKSSLLDSALPQLEVTQGNDHERVLDLSFGDEAGNIGGRHESSDDVLPVVEIHGVLE